MAGSIPTETIIIPKGNLEFPISMLDELRKLGMIVEVDNGAVVLRDDFVATAEGVPLTPEQAKVLVKMNRRTINFTINLLCKWEKEKFTEY